MNLFRVRYFTAEGKGEAIVVGDNAAKVTAVIKRELDVTNSRIRRIDTDVGEGKEKILRKWNVV